MTFISDRNINGAFGFLVNITWTLEILRLILPFRFIEFNVQISIKRRISQYIYNGKNMKLEREQMVKGKFNIKF